MSRDEDPQPTIQQDEHEPRSGERKSPLTLKDWVGFVFSMIALVVSVSSLYLANIHIEDNTLARLVDLDVASSQPKGYPAPTKFVVAHMVFANAGNRAAVVFKVEYELHAPDKVDGTSGAAIAGFGAEAVSDKDPFPLLIQPRDVRVVDLLIPVKYIADNSKLGTPIKLSSDQMGWRFVCRLRFLSLDSRGQLHDIMSEDLFTVSVSTTDWSDVGPVKGLGEVAVSLLK